MSTFAVFDWLPAFKTQLEARGGLAGVTVSDYEVPEPERDREHIILGNWSQTDTHYDMGSTFLEDIELEGRVTVRKPDTARAARDRALAIVKEVKDQLIADGSTNATVLDAYISRATGQGLLWADGGYVCVIEFTIRVRAANE